MKDMEKLYKERVERIKKTIRLEKSDRVPILSMISTWSAWYAGYTAKEVLYEPEKSYLSIKKIVEDFEWDFIFPPGATTPMALYEILGGEEYIVRDEDTTMQHPEAIIMKPEEYPDLISNPYKFITEKILPRKYKNLRNDGNSKYEILSKALKKFIESGAQGKAFKEKFRQEQGMPYAASIITQAPMDIIEDFMRGFKGITIDIRRHPKEVIAACEELLPLMLRMADVGIDKEDELPIVFIPLHIGPYLKPKDFEKFYWPTFKKLLEGLVAKEYTPFLFLENKWEPYFEYLQELPKGKIMGIFEHDDMKKAKDALGKVMCIGGGMPVQLLQYGTKEECIAHAKKSIDAAAPGGGYIFSTDKALLSPNDGKPENIAAVNQFVKEYGVY